MSSEVVKISNLSKSYGPIEVLKGVNLVFRAGEVHAFIGANGAGKSTLLGCLSGAVAPTSGEIVVRGEAVNKLTPRTAIHKGIAIIYQHFQVIDGLTVADNIFLGNEIESFGVVDGRAQIEQSQRLLSRLQSVIDPRDDVARLSIGERQIVEIARALRLHPQVLILDEPTAALSDREMVALHDVVRQLAKDEGLAIVYVTHLLDEIAEIADVVTVLRDGVVAWTRPVAQASVDEIARTIAPRLEAGAQKRRRAAESGPIMRLQDYRSDFTGPLTLDLGKGEILGVYGLLGSGRTDFLESLIGARAAAGGICEIAGRSFAPKGPSSALDRGVALVASDRKEQSLFGELAAIDNLLMPHYSGAAKRGSSHRQIFEQTAEDVGLVPRLPHLAASRFSGGNAQKLAMGRWLIPGLDIRVLLLDEPTQGVDIGARADLYRLLFKFAESGGSVIVASSDPAEIVAVSDRVLVLAHGQQITLLDGDVHEDQLVRLAHQSSATFMQRSPEVQNSAE